MRVCAQVAQSIHPGMGNVIREKNFLPFRCGLLDGDVLHHGIERADIPGTVLIGGKPLVCFKEVRFSAKGKEVAPLLI